MLFTLMKTRQEARIEQICQRLKSEIKNVFISQKHKLDLLETKIQANDPKLLLLKGYSITTVNGKVVRSKSQVIRGDKIKTTLQDGSFESTII